MEPHKKDLEKFLEPYRPSFNHGPEVYFIQALEFVNKFYSDEMRAIASVKFDEVRSDFFFREYTWVVHATGFSAKAVGNFMPRLLKAYGPWDTLCDEPFDQMMDRVKLVCNNPQKAKAVWKTSAIIRDGIKSSGWLGFKKEQLSTTQLLATLPYVGKVTCFHLGRNIGLLDCVKPDLHLERMASHWGFSSCEEMCRAVRRDKNMPLGIVDLVLWYTASTFGTIGIRKEDTR